MNTKAHYCLIIIILFFTVSCKSRNDRISSSETMDKSENENTKDFGTSPKEKGKKIGKAIFYLENSGSMFGYVNGNFPTEYVHVVSELANKPRFVEERTNREFYFVNGGENIEITRIGENPAMLKNKLNVAGFNCGDVSKSNLNSMFQLALSKAKNDTVSILISDAIYDIGKQSSPMGDLALEGRETRTKFIERLSEGGLQTIIIKIISDFDGKYFPVNGGFVELNQKRPFYVFVFGETELLNEYFPEDYLKSLNGFSDIARFLKLSELKIPHQITTHNKVGDFRFDKYDKNKLENVKPDRHGLGFQFTIATDFSGLPFSDTYLNSISNYSSNINYSINNVSEIGDVKLYGLNFIPTHLITAYTGKSPLGQLEISLLNSVPNWITDTNFENEENIEGDTSHTFGFELLTNAICEAYQYKNQKTNIVTFTFELLK